MYQVPTYSHEVQTNPYCLTSDALFSYKNMSRGLFVVHNFVMDSRYDTLENNGYKVIGNNDMFT